MVLVLVEVLASGRDGRVFVKWSDVLCEYDLDGNDDRELEDDYKGFLVANYRNEIFVVGASESRTT